MLYILFDMHTDIGYAQFCMAMCQYSICFIAPVYF